MFTTPLFAEEPSLGLFGDGDRYWRVATHQNLPWLHVKIVCDDEDGFGERNDFVMVDDPFTFEDCFVRRLGQGMRVEEIQVVTPAWINKQGRWAMEPIRSLEIGRHAEGHAAYVYHLPGGRSYSWGLEEHEVIEALPDHRVVFEAPNAAATSQH